MVLNRVQIVIASIVFLDNALLLGYKLIKVGTMKTGKITHPNVKKNMISTYNVDDRGVFTHELLHVSSTTKEIGKLYCGFYQHGLYSSFGNGLNEGYTELLNVGYFLNKPSLVDSYYQITNRIKRS